MSLHLSNLMLHRLVAGETTDEAARDHLGACVSCKARLASTRAGHDAFATDARLPERLAALTAAIAPKPARDVWRWRRRVWGVAGLALAAMLLIVVGMTRPDDPDSVRSLDPTTRRKGEAGDTLEIIRRDASGRVETLSPPWQVRPGEAIRFQVGAARRSFVGVVSIDSAHVVSAYAPQTDVLEETAAGTPRVLDGSVVLDDTLGEERIVLVLCDQARRVDDVMAAARAALKRANGDLRAMGAITSCREVVRVLEKVP